MSTESRPDYELADSLNVTTAEQHRAVGNLVRSQILGVLNDQATTISQLATALGVLKGSVSYHVRLLERTGLVRVVRTRKVRGVVERYYGKTARRFELAPPGATADAGPMMMRTVAAELERRSPSDADMVTVLHARLLPGRAGEFKHRLSALLTEFSAEHATDQPMYGLAVALYRTAVGPTGNEARPASNAPPAERTAGPAPTAGGPA